MLTIGLVGLVEMGGMLPPGDMAVHGWPHGSLWASGGPGAGGVGLFDTPRGGGEGGGLGVVGWRCHWAVDLVSSAWTLWLIDVSFGPLWVSFGCRWVLLDAAGPLWSCCGVIVGGWLVVGDCGQV